MIRPLWSWPASWAFRLTNGGAAETARRYEKKSDAEIAAEILKLQDKLNASNIPYEKQAALVQSLMPMMNGEQKARLSKIIGLMKK